MVKEFKYFLKSAVFLMFCLYLRLDCVLWRSCRLSLEKYEEIVNLLEGARQSMVDRQTELAICFDVIEVDITLLGATGVEDQLQEEVQETLESQKISGIQVTILLYSYFNVLPIQQLIIFFKDMGVNWW